MNDIICCLISYAITAIVFLGLDGVWLSVMSKKLYQPILSAHMAAKYDWTAVAVFYPLYFIGVTYFVVQPLATQSLGETAMRGALFGLIAYATYDLTNQATLSGWPWYLSLIDMTWGAVATAGVSVVTRLILEKIVT